MPPRGGWDLKPGLWDAGAALSPTGPRGPHHLGLCSAGWAQGWAGHWELASVLASQHGLQGHKAASEVALLLAAVTALAHGDCYNRTLDQS